MTIQYTDEDKIKTLKCHALIVRLAPDKSGKNDYCDYIYISTSEYDSYYKLCPLSSLLSIYS
jgi:hypothetical protein